MKHSHDDVLSVDPNAGRLTVAGIFVVRTERLLLWSTKKTPGEHVVPPKGMSMKTQSARSAESSRHVAVTTCLDVGNQD